MKTGLLMAAMVASMVRGGVSLANDHRANKYQIGDHQCETYSQWFLRAEIELAPDATEGRFAVEGEYCLAWRVAFDDDGRPAGARSAAFMNGCAIYHLQHSALAASYLAQIPTDPPGEACSAIIPSN